MLFLLKRSWWGGLAGLAILALLGFGLRAWLGGPPLARSLLDLAWGAVAFVAVLCSDLLLHGLFCRVFGEGYRRRHRELVELFRGQGPAAMLTGAAMAGVGEEALFRGLSTSPAYLVPSALLFGLLHHVRRSLWPFTLWAVFQGLLFGVALGATGALAVTMVAHFLHDLSGFALFRYVNQKAAAGDPVALPGPGLG